MDLQELAEQLSDELGRTATVFDADDRPVASSESARRVTKNHVVVPVRDSSRQLASLRLDVDSRDPLGASDYAMLDAAAGIARSLLSDGGDSSGSTREETLRLLLDDDPRTRRAAFSEAVSRRWIDRGGRTVVRAVIVDDRVGRLRRATFARHIAAATPAHSAVLREHDSVLYLVTRDPRRDIDLDEWLRRESQRLGVLVSGIGSARLDASATDLRDTAEQARVAADITAALPELRSASSIDELGGWVMLHSVTADARRLADISPAADQLCRAGDALQRETVETYLDSGGHARVACEKLHIHRTTLYYRLDNMPPLVRDALDDGLKRSTLHLALKLVRLWEATGAL